MRVAQAIETDAQTERKLRRLSNGRRVEARVQQRASVVLLAAQGWQNKDIAREVKLDRRQVALWRLRFIEGGLPALLQSALAQQVEGETRIRMRSDEIAQLVKISQRNQRQLFALALAVTAGFASGLLYLLKSLRDFLQSVFAQHGIHRQYRYCTFPAQLHCVGSCIHLVDKGRHLVCRNTAGP